MAGEFKGVCIHCFARPLVRVRVEWEWKWFVMEDFGRKFLSFKIPMSWHTPHHVRAKAILARAKRRLRLQPSSPLTPTSQPPSPPRPPRPPISFSNSKPT